MSCRWTRTSAAGDTDHHLDGSDAAAIYRELARGWRWEEFRWFARSQGVPYENIERMWSAAVAASHADAAGDGS